MCQSDENDSSEREKCKVHQSEYEDGRSGYMW